MRTTQIVLMPKSWGIAIMKISEGSCTGMFLPVPSVKPMAVMMFGRCTKMIRNRSISPLRPWPQALDLPMANQVKHLKNLMLSRPFLSRIPDQSLINGEQAEDNNTRVQPGARMGLMP